MCVRAFWVSTRDVTTRICFYVLQQLVGMSVARRHCFRLWKKSSERGGFETPLPQINIKVGPGQNPGRADLVFVWVLLSYLKIRPSAKRERVGRAGEKTAFSDGPASVGAGAWSRCRRQVTGEKEDRNEAKGTPRQFLIRLA